MEEAFDLEGTLSDDPLTVSANGLEYELTSSWNEKSKKTYVSLLSTHSDPRFQYNLGGDAAPCFYLPDYADYKAFQNDMERIITDDIKKAVEIGTLSNGIWKSRSENDAKACLHWENNIRLHYMDEFPDYDDKLHYIKGFEDGEDWQNACPCSRSHFEKNGMDVIVMENYKSKKLRKAVGEAGKSRYSVFAAKKDAPMKLVCASEHFSEAKRAALSCLKGLEKTTANTR